MQIKQQALAQHLKKQIAPLYVLIGQDNYWLEDSLHAIKSAIKSAAECDEKQLHINNPEDWGMLIEEANSYSLFSDTVLLIVNFDKKTLDAAGKKVLGEYLSAINPRCHIIIRAAQLPTKQVQWLTNEPQAMVVVSYPLNPEAMKSWIANQLKLHSLRFDALIPELIHQYTQGNMLACAQAVEKIHLSNAAHSTITAQQALEHLSDQAEYSLFELVDACLMGQTERIVHILRQAAENKTEATLVLWMLTQEIRNLLQLTYLQQQNIDFKTACGQLKIWPQRSSLYQISLKRMNGAALQPLLQYAQSIDERIKTGLSGQVWNALETLALCLGIGQLIGEPCTQ